MIGQRTVYWTMVWLVCAAVVLLGLATAFLLHTHNRQMHELREQAAQTRAHLMAQSISQRLAYAASTGIPLAKLVGVPEFLKRWHKTYPEITHIGVYDPQGQLLWRSHAADSPAAHRVASGRAELLHDGTLSASVSLQLRDSNINGLGQATALLMPAVLLVSVLACLAAYFSCAQGPWLRNHGLRTMARWAARGDYRRLLVLPQHKPFDLRTQEVAHAMRSVHERMLRMRLLIGSLRRTEPQQLRRDYLDQILRETEDQDLFTPSEPATMRLVAAQAQSLWIALLLSLGAVAPLTYALRLFQDRATAADFWSAALPPASLAVLGLAATIGWKLTTRIRSSTLSVLILSSTALLLPMLALLLGHAFHPNWVAAWNGLFAGAAMAACTRAQTHPDQCPGFFHARPQMPGAALLAWWGCLLWLAPALGYYTHAALPPTAAALALLLPVACALFLATRWDVAHSPWRVRMASMDSTQRPRHAWPLMALSMAAGLMAGLMLHALTTQTSVHSPALLQQCALGTGLGVAWSLWRIPALARRMSRLSPWIWRVLALTVISLPWITHQTGAFPALPPPAWLSTIQGWAYGLLGFLLGQGFSLATQQSQTWLTPRLLLGGMLGAALCAGMVVLGLHAWVSVLATALLLKMPSPASPRTKAPNAH